MLYYVTILCFWGAASYFVNEKWDLISLSLSLSLSSEFNCFNGLYNIKSFFSVRLCVLLILAEYAHITMPYDRRS
ncbi:MAG: hypothetical protein N7Q72_02970, partial [Spiroplasma sp. Tabriz.8]|nr:hypothetical protein [Spiroplasma sp. Tabriz.8]